MGLDISFAVVGLVLSGMGLILGLSVIIAVSTRANRGQERSEERITKLLEELESEKSRLENQVVGPHNQDVDPQTAYALEVARLHQLRADALQTLVENYHRQALGQASIQFRISVGAAIVGFLLMIYGGFIQISSYPPASGNTLLDGIAGISSGLVINLVAGIFFNQARQTRDRGTALYDRLRDDQRNRYAVDIADGIPEANLKSFVYGQIALHIVGIKTSEVDLKSIMGADVITKRDN